MDFRNCLIDVTRILAQSGQIFTDDQRRKYLKLYSKNPEEMERQKSEDLVSDVGPSESFSEALAVSSTAVLDAQKTNNDLPVSKWMESLLTQKEICRIKQTGLRVGASCYIKNHDIVLTLKGNVLQKMAGFRVYQRYGANYAGIIIFNLGNAHGYKWFCTKEYANTLQADIIQHGLQTNCEIFISNFKSKPVPIIYATRNIQENEYLCLSKQNLSKLNESFLSWNAMSTGNVRRSYRVPNRSKAFEEMYETNILSKKQEGLEKRIHNGESGIFTTRAFSQGEFLVEYFGELIDETTALGRLNSMPAELGPYIFFLGSKFRNYCIDGSRTEDSLARFVGHSIRKSNCKTICIWINETPRVFLVAKNSIEENTQLFYDYDDRNTKFHFLSE